MTKICFVVTDPMNLYSLFRDQFLYLQREGFEVYAISSKGKEHSIMKSMGVKSYEIDMARTPKLFSDFISLCRLWWHFLFNRYDIVHVSTPKASLLASIGAKLAFSRNIVYMVRGRAYENFSGIKYKLYCFLERIICMLSDGVLIISREIMDDMISRKIVPSSKARLVLNGSSNGVDLSKFSRKPFQNKSDDGVRSMLQIPESSFVFLYSGRIRAEKGINELVEAFLKIENSYDVSLIIQGVFEDFDPLSSEVSAQISTNPNIYVQPWTDNVIPYYQAADVFVFPSHREGFGNVALEAAAMGLPVIAFDVIGCRESVVDGLTGTLVAFKDVESLSNAMIDFVEHPNKAILYGERGYKRVVELFDSKKVWDFLSDYYQEIAMIK